MEQSTDVMCQQLGSRKLPMPTASADALTTADVAKLFWSAFYPDDLIIDEETNQILVSYADDYAKFIWEIDTSPNGSPLLRTIEIHAPVAGITQTIFSEHLIENGILTEVDINKAFDFDDFSDHFLITYDGGTNGFSQHFLAHIKALLSPTQP